MTANFDMSLHEAISTQRAMRRITDEPIDDALILKLIEYGTRAPNAGNEQRWEFIVVRDPELKAKIAAQNSFMWKLARGAEIKKEKQFEGRAKTNAAMEWSVEHFADYPAMIIACHRGPGVGWPRILVASTYSSIVPAVQNILLAARAANLAGNLTTMPLWNTRKSRRLLGLPRDVTPSLLITLGRPAGKYGPSQRKPVGDVVSLDRYGHRPWQGQHADEVK
jgi:nitroreductase